MKLHLSRNSDINAFTGYGEGYVMVNQTRYERSLVVLRERVLSDWRPAGFDTLEAADFAELAAMAPEIVLLGTGSRLRFPRPELTRALHEARIGLEVMDLRAACRTFNMLIAENRMAVAALIPV